MYTADHVFKECQFYPRNPDLVAIDTNIIAKSPVRLLVSGMGDALATWWEADACASAYAKNLAYGGSGSGYITMAALALAKLCYDTLLECGIEARISCEKGVVTPALEKIVETNMLLSSVAVENTGTVTAHSIHNGFTILEQRHKSYHGEVVAFGTVVQLVLEGQAKKDLYEVINFCDTIGLPYTLADINLADITDEELMKVAERATHPSEFIHGYAFPVTSDLVFNSIKAADSIGMAFKEQK
jgi:glycerol dehydrogenase